MNWTEFVIWYDSRSRYADNPTQRSADVELMRIAAQGSDNWPSNQAQAVEAIRRYNLS